ncbi:hypothetical protein PTW35_25860 (plasmid) [Photobacterium sp. DA100]|uniref:hypothetical protein n=1 Tax=Photobacterium sp. DA100 TaxID=3027472 RepID=UPI002479EBA2|nr:hypothetical protein [Photobacterium sp. DA100]WEM44684.1 hypothetical protein PTW35_25860 [Photobacterium sp. DA100]
MKKIRLFHRRFNFSSKPADRVKCEHSLAHSLRIRPPTAVKNTKKLEWNHELLEKNLIWVNGQQSSLHDWPEEKRLELLYEIAPYPKKKNQTKLQTQLRQYRKKMKTAVESEQNKGNQATADFLRSVLDMDRHVPYSRIEVFAKLTMQRKKQRIKMLETYLNAHNQLCQKPPANNIYVQEGIFKVPQQWGVGTDVISLSEYIAFTCQFLEVHFPDYEIKAIVGHDDERSAEANTGAHTHYFLSGKNRVTGEFDLRKQQVAVVNEYIKRTEPNTKLLPADGKLTRKLSQKFGRYFQKMLFEYANQHLFFGKGLVAKLAPASERRSAKRKEMNREASLAKSERSHSYHTHQLELLQGKIELAEKKHAALLDENEKAVQQLSQFIDDIEFVEVQLNQLQVERGTMQLEVSDLKVESSRLTILTQTLTQNLVPKIVEIFKKVLLSINAKDRGLVKKQSEYLNSVLYSTLDLPSELANKIASEVASLQAPETVALDACDTDIGHDGK